MSFPKIRNLGKYGIITDVDPFDLPPEAFSWGVNVRFRNDHVTRGPVWRNVHNLGTVNPRFLVGAQPSSGQDLLFIGYESGQVFKYASGAESDVSIASYTPSTTEGVWTSCNLADVRYVNRDDRPPWYYRITDTVFQNLTLATGTTPWASGWTTKLLRACGGALVALNVTKSGVNFPTLVKTSSMPLAGTAPVSWDQTTPSTLATENTLAEMDGPIIDACLLKNRLFIYGFNSVWSMTPSNDSFVFDYLPAFANRGAINANCSIEVRGRHYVFGSEDIWMHDGVTDVSVCDGKTRDFIFGGLNLSKANRCFVAYNAQLKQISFCYMSGDKGVNTGFTGAEGCNRAAVLDLGTMTWTFDDLPFVFFGTRANLDSTLTWTTASPQTWATIGGAWIDQEDTQRKNLVFVGDTNAAYSLTKSLYAFDGVGALSTTAFTVDTNATKGCYLERDGIDLDQLDEDLRGYKTINSIYPQGRLDINAPPIQFSFGAADNYNDVPVFSAYQTWDGVVYDKVDFGASGRFLSMKILFPDYNYMSLSGFDLDYQITGER